jgi:hypothetical protein
MEMEKQFFGDFFTGTPLSTRLALLGYVCVAGWPELAVVARKRATGEKVSSDDLWSAVIEARPQYAPMAALYAWAAAEALRVDDYPTAASKIKDMPYYGYGGLSYLLL